MACAVAASIAVNYAAPGEFLEAIIEHIPESQIKEGLQRALEVPGEDVPLAVAILGNGEKATAMDTVPFALWTAANHLNDYKQSLVGCCSGIGRHGYHCRDCWRNNGCFYGRSRNRLAFVREPLRY